MVFKKKGFFMKNKQSFKTAAVSLIAMLTALASARAAERVATTISGTFSENNIYGNHTIGDYTNHDANPADNTFTFNGSAKYTGSSDLDIYGSFTDTVNKKAEGNKVVIDKLTFTNNNVDTTIYGGYSHNRGGDAERNSVTINDEFSSVTSADKTVYIYGGYSYDGAT